MLVRAWLRLLIWTPVTNIYQTQKSWVWFASDPPIEPKPCNMEILSGCCMPPLDSSFCRPSIYDTNTVLALNISTTYYCYVTKWFYLHPHQIRHFLALSSDASYCADAGFNARIGTSLQPRDPDPNLVGLVGRIRFNCQNQNQVPENS